MLRGPFDRPQGRASQRDTAIKAWGLALDEGEKPQRRFDPKTAVKFTKARDTVVSPQPIHSSGFDFSRKCKPCTAGNPDRFNTVAATKTNERASAHQGRQQFETAGSPCWRVTLIGVDGYVEALSAESGSERSCAGAPHHQQNQLARCWANLRPPPPATNKKPRVTARGLSLAKGLVAAFRGFHRLSASQHHPPSALQVVPRLFATGLKDHTLSREGAMWRNRWVAPPVPAGINAPR